MRRYYWILCGLRVQHSIIGDVGMQTETISLGNSGLSRLQKKVLIRRCSNLCRRKVETLPSCGSAY